MAIADVTTALSRRLASFLRSTNGNAMIIATLSAIPMIGSVGLAVDYMRAVRASEELQHVADAAALAAAAAQNVSGTSSEKLSQRVQIATNYITASVARVSDIELVGTPTVTPGPNTIDVEVNAKVKGSFINVLGALKNKNAEVGGGSLGNQAGDSSNYDVDLKVKSKVAFSEDSYLCLLAMNPTQTQSIYFQGNSKFMATCSVHANSNATTAIRTWGSAEAYAASFTARGGWAGSGFDPDPVSTGAWVDDPYNNSSYVMALPTAGSCMTAAQMGLPSSGSGSKGSTSSGAFVKDSSYTLPPGTYCGGIEGKTHAHITLQKGIYVLKDGDLKLDAGSEIHAEDGTLIYLTGNSSNVDITSGAIVELTGPNNDNTTSTDPAYAWRGWAILQDRTTGVGNTNTIYSKGGVNIRGGVYTPSQKLVVWANGDMNSDSEYFPMIVDTLNMNGTATLFVNLNWDEESLDQPTKLTQAGKVFVSQ
ncbi:MAG TPA: pilus assembly protein TadG-related protein [Aestuariivirga sp.]|nr:pilus assembly protein TadG-related protein [Aestuariivirga sp.]